MPRCTGTPHPTSPSKIRGSTHTHTPVNTEEENVDSNDVGNRISSFDGGSPAS